MEQTLQYLMVNPYIWLLITILTLISFFLGIYFDHRGRIGKRLACVYKSNKLIQMPSSSNEKLKIFYDNIKINSLTSTCYTFWNGGNGIIENSDMVDTIPLEIKFDSNCQILDASPVSINEPSNNINFSLSGNTISISFDYFAKNEGFIIQIIYTGDSDSFSIGGKIKGGHKIIPVASPAYDRKRVIGFHFMRIAKFFSLFYFLYLGYELLSKPELFKNWTIYIAIIFLFSITLFIDFKDQKNIPPKNLLL